MNKDFVSFDLAKKLKEKGFYYKCVATYDNDCMLGYNYIQPTNIRAIGFDDCLCSHNVENDGCIDAPTISQVLKWLIEEKDIFIELEYINQKACGCTIIIQKTGGLIAKWNWDKFNYAIKNPLVGNTYEKAALAGIEYCLNNLI